MVAYCNRIFPPLVVISIIAVIYGMLSGGAADEYWLTISGEWTMPRIAFHGVGGLMLAYVGICWLGAAIGTSPHRSIGDSIPSTIIRIPCSMGIWPRRNQGVERNQQTGGKAGVGHQIDDRTRTV